MIELKTEEEFLDFKEDYCNLPKFSPNRVLYKGQTYIIKEGAAYDIRRYPDSFVEDFYHPGYYITREDSCIYLKFSLIAGSDLFDKDDDESWARIEPTPLSTAFSADWVRRAQECQKVYLYSIHGIMYSTMSDSELKAIGLLKGKKNNDVWFHYTELDQLDGHMPYRKFNNIYKKIDIELKKQELQYVTDSKLVMQELKKVQNDNLKFGVVSPTFTALEGITNTFGVELESIAGRLAEGEEDNLNLRTVHDGSLRVDGNEPEGAEYVTGVLVGDTGLAQLYEICRVLSKRCKLNHQCGLHIHVGGLDWSKEDVVYSYLLAELLESEIFAMLPSSRRNNEYCRNLTPLILKKRSLLQAAKNKNDYNVIIEELYDTILIEATFPTGSKVDKDKFISSSSYSKNQQHPAGAKCGYNKSYQRYCWLNYITLLYNTKGNRNSHTLEVRNHSGTFNYIKVRNWLKICLAFCKFVENHKSLILNNNVTLETMISKIYPKTGTELVKYINERKDVFKTSSEAIDYISEEHARKTLKEVVCA